MTQITIDTAIPSVAVDGIAWAVPDAPPVIVPPPVVTDPPTASNAGWFKPTTQAQLQGLLNDAIANNYVAMLDPRTELEISTTLTMLPKDSGGWPHGLIGNGAKLSGVMNDGSPVVRLQGTVGPNGYSNSRAFVFSELAITGGAVSGTNVGRCLEVICPKGGEIRGRFEKLTMIGSSADFGVYLEGDLYESWFRDLSIESCVGSGLGVRNGPGVISNLKIHDMNLSRNAGYGIDTDSRHLHCVGGSFINNGLGGIKAARGLTVADDLQFENSGFVAIDVTSTIQYSMRVTNCEASSDGAATHGTGSKPMQYLLRCPASQNGLLYFPGGNANSVTMYGSNGLVMALRAP